MRALALVLAVALGVTPAQTLSTALRTAKGREVEYFYAQKVSARETGDKSVRCDAGDKCMVPIGYPEAVEKPIEAEEVQEQPQEERSLTYYGNCRITFYCPCAACCGSWGNATASGVMPTASRTVACGDLPFGTRLLIDGQEYVVEDRGVGAQQIDIFVNGHQEALDRGLYYADVYIVG